MPHAEPQRTSTPVPVLPLAAVQAARERLAPVVPRSPMLRLPPGDAPARAEAPPGDDLEIFLKLENLQPIGSFKLRGAGNAMLQLPAARLSRGVWTASAGNMAQGVAWMARRLGVPCTAVVPDSAPAAKLRAVEDMGARLLRLSYAEWWRCIEEHECDSVDGTLVHPVSDPEVVAGNGTIGLEILDDLADVDAIVIPWGGGGLSVGIASAIRALRPQTRIYACEVQTAAPLAAALAAGAPRTIERTPSFVDGIGSASVLPELWPAACRLLDGSIVVSLAAVCDAIRMLAERCRIIAEGAGAAAVAAALSGDAGRGRIVCIVSGGNIDRAVLSPILRGEMPLLP